MISAASLVKSFRVPVRRDGFAAALKSVVRREYREVRAVDGISFAVGEGERVGFLGPNGAGKTTTLKMLSGLLHPTAGSVVVAGYEPFRRHHAFLRSITYVAGQKERLIWDLPPLDTFEYLQAVYRIGDDEFRNTRDELVDLLEIANVVDKPARRLSLGERMKCELAAALIHRPQVLFLDEPTIGLDVHMQHVIRRLIRQYNERHGATIILTSHDLRDVEALCPRIMVIDEGRMLYDGALKDFVAEFASSKRITIAWNGPPAAVLLEGLGAVVGELADGRTTVDVARDGVRAVVTRIDGDRRVREFRVEDPPIEQVFIEVYQRRAARPGAAAP